VTCARTSEVVERITGTIDPDRIADLDRHVEACPACRAAREELDAIASRIRPLPGEIDERELARDVATLIRLEKLPERPRRWPYAVAPLAVAAAIAIAFVRPPDDGFTARAGGEAEPDRWVSIEAHRAKKDGAGYENVGADIAASDALVFSVLNRPESPHRYAMILAFDERGEIYWYHPAYVDAAANPRSIEVPAARDPTTLADAVRHPLAPGWLCVVGLFSKRPLDVVSVEAVVKRTLAGRRITEIERLAIDDTGQHRILLRVEADR
jgi:hypothetical protein